MPDEEGPKNHFVRFKQHVDANISAGLHGVLSLPSLVSRNASDGSVQSAASPSGAAATASTSSPDPFSNDWVHFLTRSAYSPILLEDLPVQPRPRDLPPDVDPRSVRFTFCDAFEDLLVVASGRPLPDIRTKCEINRAWLGSSWPSSAFLDPRDLRAWRMMSLGLFDDFPFARGPWPIAPRYAPPPLGREEEEDQNQDEGRRRYVQDEQGHRWEGDGAIARTDDSKEADHRPAEPLARRKHPGDGDLFEELDKVFKALHKVLEDEVGSFWTPGRKRDEARQEKRRSASDENAEDGPQAEDDLYSAVRSAYSAANRSLGAFVKSISEGKFNVNGHGEFSRSHGETTAGNTGEATEDGEEVITRTEEHVDRFGNLHVRTETTRRNARGEQIGKETHYSVRYQGRSQGRSPVTDELAKQESSPVEWGSSPSRTDVEAAKSSRKTGWFW